VSLPLYERMEGAKGVSSCGRGWKGEGVRIGSVLDVTVCVAGGGDDAGDAGGELGVNAGGEMVGEIVGKTAAVTLSDFTEESYTTEPDREPVGSANKIT
jgi:hypothetical protein